MEVYIYIYIYIYIHSFLTALPLVRANGTYCIRSSEGPRVSLDVYVRV
jgi:hypothetical protein